jgi:tRNA 2-thiouridine synthesizing protein A
MSVDPNIVQLDARGKRCPYPLLETRAWFKDKPSGTKLELLTTDPLAPIDIAAWCARGGHLLLHELIEGEQCSLLIEKT